MPKWPGMSVPPGSETWANARVGHPGTWEVLLLPFLRSRFGISEKESWPAALSVQELCGGTESAIRTNDAGSKWYCQAKATKCGKKSSKKS